MIDERRIGELLIRWEQAKESGRGLSVEELCIESPELKEELQRRIDSIQAMGWLHDFSDDGHSEFLEAAGISTVPNQAHETVLPNERRSADSFAVAILNSGLMTTEQVAKFREDHPTADARSLAMLLVAHEQLTSYQATVLLLGKDQPLILDRYVILDEIGSGGMGTVYKALHRQMDRIVALKILPKVVVDSPEKVSRFQREARAAAKLINPHIVTAFDANECECTHYIAMEYVDGQDLSRVVRELGPLPVGTAVDYVIQAAQGFQHAHAEGVCHRDIKPANLLLDDKGVVKVLDMGLASIEFIGSGERTELTHAGTVMGTIAFMAPEQALDTRQADQRSDIYALGCVLYFMLHGHAPYREETDMMVLLAHRESEVPSLAAGRNDVPSALDDVFRKMVAKQPANRYQSMADVIVALKQVELPSEANAEQALPLHRRSSDPKATAPAVTVNAQERQDQPSRQRSGRRIGLWVIGSAVLAAAVFFAAIVLKVETASGMIVLEIDQPEIAGATVSVDGKKKITIASGEGKEPIEVVADDKQHTLRVTRGGFETFTKSFTVVAKGEQKIKVHLKPLTAEKTQTKPTGAPIDKPSVAWKPGPAKNVLPGLVARPTVIPGIVRWQMYTVAPRTNVTSIAWHPDGKQFACSTEEGAIRIYDAEKLALNRLLIGHDNAVNCVAWSPDGKVLASVGADRTLRLWRGESNESEILDRDHGYYLSVAWSPDGKWLAAGDIQHGFVRMWSSDGKPGPIARLPRPVRCVAWSADSTQLAAGFESTIQLIQADGTLSRTLEGHTGRVESLAWCPDGQWLASGGKDRVARLWKPDGTAGPVLEGHHNPVYSLSWNNDGRLVTGSSNVKVWEADFAPNARFEGLIYTGSASEVAWSPDGNHLLVGGQDTLAIWHANGIPGPNYQAEAQKTDVWDVAWQPGGDKIVAAQMIQKWLFNSAGTNAAPFGTTPHDQTEHVGWSPDGKWIATGEWSGLRLWDAEGLLVREYSPAKGISDLAWNPDGEHIAAGIHDPENPQVIVYAREGETQTVIPQPDLIRHLCWNIDGSLLATATPGSQGILQTWNSNGENVFSSKVLGRWHTLAWHPHKDQLVAYNEAQGHIQILDLATDKIVRNFEPGASAVPSMEWSADGQLLAACTNDVNGIRVWKEDGTRCQVLKASGYVPHHISWCDDNEHIISSGTDKRMIMWNLETGEPVWSAVFLLGEQNAVTFTLAGEILFRTPDAPRHLVYVVERTPGKQELLNFDEFHRLVQRQAD